MSVTVVDVRVQPEWNDWWGLVFIGQRKRLCFPVSSHTKYHCHGAHLCRTAAAKLRSTERLRVTPSLCL